MSFKDKGSYSVQRTAYSVASGRAGFVQRTASCVQRTKTHSQLSRSTQYAVRRTQYAVRSTQYERGTILIITLWVVSILALFAVGIGYRMGLLIKMAGYKRDVKVARELAFAGFSWSLAQLAQDANAYDSLYECGITLEDEEEPDKVFQRLPVGQGYFTISHAVRESRKWILKPGFTDEERKINVNLAPFELLAALPGVTPSLASAMIDWRDKNDDPLLDESGNEKPFGAEQEQYEELAFSCKNAPFQAMEELRLVLGMTDEVYREIEPMLTVYGDGKVNINTAPAPVLEVLARASFDQVGGLERDIEHLVERIIDHRDGFDDEEGTEGDEPFQNIKGDMSRLLLGTEERRLMDHMAEHYLTVSSRLFQIASWGFLENPERRYLVRALVERGGGTKPTLTVRRWQEGFM
ncbi:MAG: general secretion pathway protein GspK [Candidatus Omnitrophica bacterium]|nr:general secretion pathway protein GspK [Candidatus Omnitrophota bacterium]